MSGHFHRRYGEVSYVTVTFYGNGGLTSSSEAVVALEVRRGTLFKDIVKPEFFQSGTAKPQHGFTFVQSDVNTIVDGEYVVRANITVHVIYKITFREVQVGSDLSGKTIYFDTSKTVRTLAFGASIRQTLFQTNYIYGPGMVNMFIGFSSSAYTAPDYTFIAREYTEEEEGTDPYGLITAYRASTGWLRNELFVPPGFIVTSIYKVSGGFEDTDDPIYFSLADAWYYE